MLRYNWAYSEGAIQIHDEFKGMAYDEFVSVPLDEVDEYVRTVCKEYRMSYEYAMDKLYYCDLTVMYAKVSNEKAFSTYNDYLNLDEKAQGKYISDYGVPKPYVFTLVTPQVQKDYMEKSNNALRGMYRQGGRLNE